MHLDASCLFLNNFENDASSWLIMQPAHKVIILFSYADIGATSKLEYKGWRNRHFVFESEPVK
jgi:hypothetical protein